MPIYRYTALELGSGQEKHGTIESRSQAEAAAELKAQGLSPIAIANLASADAPLIEPAAKRNKFLSQALARLSAALKHGRALGRPISRKSRMVFTRQLATLVNAGMPLVRGLEVLRRQERNEAFAEVLRDLGEAIGAGGSLSDGLLRHPEVFEALYVNMVKAGEAGGVLGPVLERLAQFMEKSERLRGRVKAAMIYPVVIIAVAGGIVAVLMVFVVPKFEQIFSGLLKGQQLPALTRILMGISVFLRVHVGLVAGVAGLGWLSFTLARKSERGGWCLDWLSLRAPVVGDLALKSAIARFARTFGSLLSSGVPILDALTITRQTSGNVHVSAALGRIHDRIKQGDSIARPLEETALFPGMVTGMIQVGEETGALPAMLGRIADIYDEEVDNAVAGLTSVIEPIMVVLMAVVVGVIVVALFLPIVSIIQHLQ